MNGLFARMRSFWRGVRNPARLDAEMEEEMRFHIDMEAERIAREQGVGAAEARRRAAAAFGGTEKHKEAGRDARALSGVAGLALDVKIARRMLAKSPALTLVGGMAMAVAIAVGAGFFTFMNALLDPHLPVDEGERLVALENWDVGASDEELRSLHDFAAWRAGMRTVREISAFAMVQQRVIGGSELPATAEVARMTASAFQAARVPPLLGRYVVEADEREGAPPVAVIGFDVWKRRFGGDPAVLGRRILLGDTAHTVVGVMPQGYAFPMDHSVWTALRHDPARFGPRQGPEVHVFGRLAPGATAEQAQRELAAFGRRAAAASPGTHARLRPRVHPYTYPLDDVQDVAESRFGSAAMQFLASLLLVAVAANVAVLVYARTAMRRGEIAVRTALGASRTRIVTQLFVEAFLLALGAAALGLGIAHAALRQVKLQMEGVMRVGFWIDFGVRPAALLFVLGMAVLAALIVGVLPALQSTGRHLQADLRRVGAGTTPGMGRTWTALIVAQVAIAVAVLPTALNQAGREMGWLLSRPAFPAAEYLAAPLDLAAELRPGMDAAAFRAEVATRLGDRMGELLRRLEADPAVAGASFSARLPDRAGAVHVDGGVAPLPGSQAEQRVSSRGVDPGYFGLFGARILTGRGFRDASAREVVVSRSYVRNVLGGGAAVGRRLRFVPGPGGAAETAGPDAWHEIVGVVDDLHANPLQPDRVPGVVYYPVAPGQTQSARLAVRVRGGDAAAYAPRLRALATEVDPALRLGEVRSLDDVERPPVVRVVLAALVLVVASVLLLSAAGIHALMSFAVTQRRREIGIRAALGAPPRRLLASVFARALGQLALGAALGAVLGGAMLGRATRPAYAGLLLGTVGVMMVAAGAAAALGPARRGLRIQPMEALRAE